MSIKLKPCPFCGGKAEVIRVTDDYPNYVINCRKCRISTAWYADVKQLSELWNKRTNERHGKWILEREPDGKPYCFHCSVCDSDFHHIGIKTAFDFCPNCGAKMDLEEQKMTNYEKIQDMTVDELAEFLGDTPEICDFCVYEGCCHDNLNCDCIVGTKLWLEQEAEKR